jgi:hypothetical protein
MGFVSKKRLPRCFSRVWTSQYGFHGRTIGTAKRNSYPVVYLRPVLGGRPVKPIRVKPVSPGQSVCRCGRECILYGNRLPGKSAVVERRCVSNLLALLVCEAVRMETASSIIMGLSHDPPAPNFTNISCIRWVMQILGSLLLNCHQGDQGPRSS